MRTSRKGTFVAVTLAALLSAPLPAWAKTTAQLKVEVSDAQARLAELGSEAEQAEYDLLTSATELEATKQRISEVEARIPQTQRDYDEARDALGEIVADSYRSGTPTLLDVVLGARDFEDLASRITYANKVADHQREAVDTVRELKDSLEGQKKDLELERSRQEELTAQQAERLRVAQEAIDEARKYYEGLSRELQEAIAAEQRAAAQAAMERSRATAAQAQARASQTWSVTGPSPVAPVASIAPSYDEDTVVGWSVQGGSTGDASVVAGPDAREANPDYPVSVPDAMPEGGDAQGQAYAEVPSGEAAGVVGTGIVDVPASDGPAAEATTSGDDARSNVEWQNHGETGEHDAAQEVAEASAPELGDPVEPGQSLPAEHEASQQNVAQPEATQDQPQEGQPELDATSATAGQESVTDDQELTTAVAADEPAQGATAGEYSAEASDLVARASSIIGSAYQWSGYNWTGDTSTSAFTCSGVVDYALGRSSRSSSPETLYAEVGSNLVTDIDDLKYGDLVFFQWDGRYPGHVGVYIGDGNMIDASWDGVGIRSVARESFIGGGTIV